MTERTVLQDFAEGIAANVTGVPKSTVSGHIDVGVVEWVVLIELIMSIISTLMAECQQSKSELMTSILYPNIWQRVRFRSLVRQECRSCSLPQWRSEANKVTDALLAAGKTEEETVVGQIIDQCREGGY